MSAAERVDFDLSIELFDLWYEGRSEETIEVPAKKSKRGMTVEHRYKSVYERLGLAEKNAGFAANDFERMLAEMVTSGEISIEDLDALIAEHGSAEAVLRMVAQ